MPNAHAAIKKMSNTGKTLLISAFPGLSVQKTVGPPSVYSNVQMELLDSARSGDLQRVQELLRAGADPAQADDMERTPLQVAAANGHMNILVYLKSVIQERQDAVIESLSFHKLPYEMTELILKKSGLYI